MKTLKLTQDEIEEIIQMTLNEVLKIDDLVNKALLSKDIMSRITEEYVINEGLIISQSPNITKRLLNMVYPRKYGIIVRIEDNINNKSMPSILLIFTRGIKNITKEYIQELTRLINNCGWFVSSIFYNNNTYLNIEEIFNFNNTDTFTVSLEPKFDTEVNIDNYPTKLFHVTQTKNLDRIKKQGLTPRNNCKTAYHPKRIYLLNNSNRWVDVARSLFNITNNVINNYVDERSYSLIEIDVESFKERGYNLMYDPNSSEEAFFTTSTIQPSLLKVIDETRI